MVQATGAWRNASVALSQGIAFKVIELRSAWGNLMKGREGRRLRAEGRGLLRSKRIVVREIK